MFIQLEDAVVNTDVIEYFGEGYICFSGRDITTQITDADYKLLLTTLLPKGKLVKDKEANSELLQLFEQLHKLTGGKGKTVFTLGREKKLNDLLTKHRMTKENLITAATNIGKDTFLQGENDNKKRYGDIDYLLRPDKAAKWSDEQTKKKSMF